MKRILRTLLLSAAALLSTAFCAAHAAPANEQFFPVLCTAVVPMRRTACHGRMASRTTSSSSTRAGGINGVKITYEECETGYATDKRRRVL